MPAGRCTSCMHLCNPDLLGCPESDQPCPKGRVYYCGQLCQAEDAEKHKTRFHRREKVVVCRHFLRGHCGYGDRCWKQHPSSPATKEATYNALVVEKCDNAAADDDDSIYNVIMEALEAGKKAPDSSHRLVQEDGTEDPKHSSCEQASFSSGCPPSFVDNEVPVADDHDDHGLEEEDFPQEDVGGRRQSFSKKSRLEMKREARKNKKAARKRDKLAKGTSVGLVAGGDQDGNPEVTPKGDQMDAEDDPMDVAVCEDSDGRDLNSGASSPDCVETSAADDDDSSSRRLTKKEKKREERRLMNMNRKKERHESKLHHASMEYLKGKERSRLLMQEGKHLECAVELTKMALLNNGDFELYVWRRDCYLALGKVKNAVKDAVQAVELMKSEEDLVALLRLQLMVGYAKDARQTLEALGEDAPEEERGLVGKVEAGLVNVNDALNNEDWVKALELVAELESTCTHSDEIQLMKAEAQLHLHIYPEAVEILKKFKHLLKDDLQYTYLHAISEYYTGASWWQTDEPAEQGLLKTFASCRHLFPRAAKIGDRATTMRAIFKNVQLLVKNQHKSLAKQMLKAGFTLDPNNLSFMADVHCLMSSLHDNDEDKLKDLSLSLRLKETFLAYYERGNVYRSKLKYDEALSDYENAHRLRPDNVIVQRLLELTRRHINASHREDLRNVKNDLYAVLGVSHGASTEEIKKAFRLKAKEFHPDRHSASNPETRIENEKKMKVVTKAYRVLKDQRQREMYDRQSKRSASSDVDLDFSDEDYECYDSSDDEAANVGPVDDVFPDLFSFMYRLNMLSRMSMAEHGAAGGASAYSSPNFFTGKSGKGRGGGHK